MSKSTDNSSLGDRMKEYESQEQRIPHDEHIILRIDGHKFSKFTKGFKRPYDKILRDSMIETTKDLVREFGAVTGYTQSDEISLVIPSIYTLDLVPVKFPRIDDGDICRNRLTKEETLVEWDEVYSDREDRTDVIYFGDDEHEIHTIYGCQYVDSKEPELSEHEVQERKTYNDKYEFFSAENLQNQQIYSGRTQKISSLVAAFCTMRFNYNLGVLTSKFLVLNDSPEYRQILANKVGTAWFDCRIYGVKSDEEAFNSIMWRVRDSQKNARSMHASTYCKHKDLLNLNGPEQSKFCLDSTGEDYDKMPESFKYGTLVKKEVYMKDVHYRDLNYKDRKLFGTDEMIQVQRTRITSLVKPMTTFSRENVEFVMSKTV